MNYKCQSKNEFKTPGMISALLVIVPTFYFHPLSFIIHPCLLRGDNNIVLLNVTPSFLKYS